MNNKVFIHATVVALLLAGCVSQTPVVVSQHYERSSPPVWARAAGQMENAGACTVKLTEVRDLRSDPESMGQIGVRAIQTADSVQWVRSSLESLSQDSRIRLADDTETAKVTIGVDILKAYSMNNAGMGRATTVALRVRYGATNDAQLYRGSDDGVNWASGDGETQSALNRALSRAIDAVHADVLQRCGIAKVAKKRSR